MKIIEMSDILKKARRSRTFGLFLSALFGACGIGFTLILLFSDEDLGVGRWINLIFMSVFIIAAISTFRLCVKEKERIKSGNIFILKLQLRHKHYEHDGDYTLFYLHFSDKIKISTDAKEYKNIAVIGDWYYIVFIGGYHAQHYNAKLYELGETAKALLK